MTSTKPEEPISVTTEDAATGAPSSTTMRARLLWCARLLAGAALVGIVIWRGGAAPLQRALQAASLPLLIGSVAFYLAGQFLSALKWRLLLQARDAHISLGECCRLYLVGMFWNLWMPTNIGGDAVRAYLTAPKCGGMTTAASSILVERLTGFLALLILAIGGLLWDAKEHARTNGAALQIVIATILLFAILFGVLAVLHRATTTTGGKPVGKFRRKLGQVSTALAFYVSRDQWLVLLWAMLLSIVFQASQILLNIVLARIVSLDVSATVFWWLVPVLALASLVPFGIGGLGVREAAAVTLLHGSGVAIGDHTATIVGWSLLWQATVWMSSLFGAIWAVKLPATRSLQNNEST